MNCLFGLKKNRALRLVLLLWAIIGLWGTAGPAAAQQDDESPPLEPALSFRHYSTADGLPSNQINVIHQDAQGFMWLATDDGLVRFDGHEFVVFKQDAADPQSGLSGNRIMTIFEDRDGALWFGTWDNGFNRFDPQMRTFQGYGVPPLLSGQLEENILPAPPPLPRGAQNDRPFFGNVNHITQDNDGKIWLASRRDIPPILFDAESETATLLDDAGIPDGLYSDMFADDQGRIWIVTPSGVARWDDGDIDVYLQEPIGEGLQVTLEGGFNDSRGRAWLIFRGRVYLYDEEADELILQGNQPAMVNGLAEDQSGLIWAATNQGVYTLDPETKNWSLFASPNPAFNDSLFNEQVRHVYVDRDNNLWLSHSRGISVFATKQQVFRNYRADPLNPENSLLPGSVTSITGRDGELWLGTEFELTHVSATGVLTHYPTPGEGRRRVTALEPSREGGIWVGTASPALYYFDPEEESFTEIVLEREEGIFSPRPWVSSLKETDQGELWLTILRQSLHRLDIDTGAQTTYTVQRRGQAPPRSDETVVNDSLLYVPSQLGFTADGLLWIGSNGEGSSLYNPETGEFRHPPVPYPLGVQVNDMHVADDGTVWFASVLGLVHYLPEANENIVYSEAEGLPATAAYHIEVDQQGFFWVTTNKGLARFDPRTETFITYDQSSGLFDVDFTNKGGWQGEDGRLYFGTYEGFFSFDPADIQVEDTAHDVVITELKLFNEPVQAGQWSLLGGEPILQDAIEVAQSIRLGPQDDLISLEFSTLEYGAPSRIRYRYRLDGLENDWNEVGSDRRFATYNNLAAGTYTFRVQATNEDGIWGEAETGLEIVVIPAWWETLWFRGAVVAVAAVLVIVAVRLRLWSVQARNLELEQEVDRQTAAIQGAELQKRRLAVLEERQRIGRELHDDIGQVIGYVSVQAQTALNYVRREETVQTEATLQRLIRVAQDAHTDIRQYILGIREGSETESQETFLTTLRAYLESVEELYDLDVRLSLPAEWDNTPFSKETETQLLRIIQECLNNARKHAGTDQASILFLDGGELVQMIVSDEGVGFDIGTAAELAHAHEPEATHFGLTIMRERAESFGGELEIRSTVGKGTQVIVNIPKQLELDPEQAVAGLTVLLVDDHQLYMEGIANLLRTRGVYIVGMASNGLEAQKLAAELRPALILMDVDMPVCNGLDATRAIKAQFPDMKIVMLTVAAEEEKLYQALQYGASGYLLKSVSGPEFFQMLRDAMSGETTLSPQLAAKLLNSFAQSGVPVASQPEGEGEREPAAAVSEPAEAVVEEPAEGVVLTFRQQQVLELVVQGLSNRDIAEQLFVSENTVKRHVSRILSQFQLKSRYELAHMYASQKKDEM